MIEPTVGRVVWFYPDTRHEDTEPQAAIISQVHSNSLINVMAIAPEGASYPVPMVPLIQEGEEVPKDEPFCTWMPYQVGQAKKDAGMMGLTPADKTELRKL